MLSFFLVDLLVAKFESKEDIARWALLKSVIMIGPSAAVFGMDQLMVRLPNQSNSIVK